MTLPYQVERREKNNKSRSNILVIRFYFENGSLRSNKVKRLLTERSKWYVSRIMSITPQLREFQALSSLKDNPMLPIILNPVDRARAYSEPRNADLSILSLPLQQVLKSSFNDSQLQAVAVSIGTHDRKKAFELSLIQGPPGLTLIFIPISTRGRKFSVAKQYYIYLASLVCRHWKNENNCCNCKRIAGCRNNTKE